jgi:hypothetical protein
MAPGFALYNASLPEKSKKRKHGYTIEEVARKDNDVSDHQDCRDAEEFVKHMFTTTKDNPQRMGRVVDRVFKHPAMQQHLPEKHTVKHSESEQVATQLGNNFQKNYVEISKKGSKATADELNLQRAGLQMVLSGKEAANKEVRKVARFIGKESNPHRIGKQSQEKRQAIESGDITRHATKHRKKRCDATDGDPIFIKIWHHFTDQIKGQRGSKRRHIGTKRVEKMCPVSGKTKITHVSVYETHDARVQIMTTEEITAAIRSWNPYLRWKKANPERVRRLRGGDITAGMIAANKCWCVGGFMKHIWGSCTICTSTRYRLSGVTAARKAFHQTCKCGPECAPCQNHADYYSSTDGMTNFLQTMLCPSPGWIADVVATAAAAAARGASAAAVAAELALETLSIHVPANTSTVVSTVCTPGAPETLAEDIVDSMSESTGKLIC